jgi:8-oxo-dGTP diphosphatase
MNFLQELETQQGVAHRAAKYYKFDHKAYQELAAKGFSFEI